MNPLKITCWEADGGWIGYLNEYPGYWTQGGTLDDLRAHLEDLHEDLTSGVIPDVRRRGESQAP